MGTQQILLIVLSVIIVGIAVAVGITMFNAQATNSNRQAIVGDMNNLASSALAFYKTPETHGGAGNVSGWGTTPTVNKIGMWLGYDWTGTSCSTGNGTYTITLAADVVTIVGCGTMEGNVSAFVNTPAANGPGKVQAIMTITGQTDAITMVLQN
ncbi:MAG: hypothetical protein P9L97_00480 [Candidatus Tenebribacter davisii]|nr:hypothetical protein [Candidatus Tenebribacter davisii]